MKRSIQVLFLSIISLPVLLGQGAHLETDPGIPTKGQPITIYFRTDQLASSAELYLYEGDLYAHTGVTIDGDRWQNVRGSWGVNSTQPQLEYLGSYRYKLEITPDIENYYLDGSNNPISEAEAVTEICLVIRDATADLQTSPDDFIEVFEQELSVSISSPSGRSVIKDRYETFDIKVASLLADSVLLYIDDTEVKKVIGSDQLSYTYYTAELGGYWVKAIAHQALETVADSFYLYVATDPVQEVLPAGVEDGINYISDTEVTLVLTAPGKSHAFVTGDFNNWLPGDDSYMKVTPDREKFWKTITGLTPGGEYRYQYVVDDVTIADPYTEKVLDPWNDKYIDEETYPGLIEYPEGLGDGHVSILQTAEPEYQWQTTGYTRPEKTDLVIYELLIRDFLAAHNYQTLIDTLGYLDKLGVNAIELMPVNEFDGNDSWGYNPSFYFAPDKYYGTKSKLKEFIDSCHSRGIAVIVDMVLNHATGSSPLAKLYWDDANNRTAADNPWFNEFATHPYNVFHDFNHDSEYTRYHAMRVMKHWIEEYKVDGYRFDLSKGFTQRVTTDVGAWGNYDANRIALWKMYADYMWSIDPDTYIILEHFADNNEETELAEYGMMLWSSPFLNGKKPFSEAAMAYDSDISWFLYEQRGWTNPNLVSYMESHDEERIMVELLANGNINISPYYSTRYILTAFDRIKLTAAFFFTMPGPKMLWQFGELGYDVSINYNGRTSAKPIRWNYYSESNRKKIYDEFSSFLSLRKNHPAFTEGTFLLTQEAGGRMKRINISHTSMDVVVLGNFDVVSNSISGEFTRTSYWYDYVTGDSINVTGVSDLLVLKPGEYRIYTTKKINNPNLSVSVKDLFAPETDNSWFSIYPNPANGIITIDPGDEAGGQVSGVRVSGLDGRVLIDINKIAGNRLDLSQLRQGIYLLEVTAGKRRGVKRIIKTE
ncbi:MAG: alpha-amylase family glycosyl hydrolase [Marinilabiliaceae bacterium]|jgi:glycosidase|nr:alpha-amylase family glycosyl hydrolase [Marinilabiliaceae bacterium]